MAKSIGFNITLNVNGKDTIVKCKADAQNLSRALGQVKTKSDIAQNSIMTWSAASTAIKNAYEGFSQVANAMTSYIQKANAATEAQTKLTTVMRQRMSASEADVKAVNDAIAAQTKLGVVSGTVQKSGMQQLATFATTRETLTTLLPAMNNLLVQQNGLNATSESAVGIANLMGKALMGNYSALKRVGITFTDAQANMIKYGDEGQRAATIAEVITQNVGNMNAEMAKTDAGKAKQAANDFGSLQVKIGAFFSQYQEGIMIMGQVGMAVSGMGTLITGIKAVVSATGLATIATKTWEVAQASFAAMSTLVTAAINGTTLSVTELRVAIKGTILSLGIIGVAVFSLNEAITFLAQKFGLLGDSSDGASDKMDGLTDTMRRQKAEAENAAKRNKDNNDILSQSAANLTGKYKTLQSQWKALKTTGDQVQWIKKNQSSFGELGLSINNVNDAYNYFVKNSANVIAALNAIAEARAWNKIHENDVVALENARRNRTVDNGGLYHGARKGDKIVSFSASADVTSFKKSLESQGFVEGRDYTATNTGHGTVDYNYTEAGAKRRRGIQNAAALSRWNQTLAPYLRNERESQNKSTELTLYAMKRARNVGVDMEGNPTHNGSVGRGGSHGGVGHVAGSNVGNTNNTPTYEAGSAEDLKAKIQKIDNQLNDKNIEESVRVKLTADKADLQTQLDELTNGSLTIPAEVTPEYVEKGSIYDLRESYKNAQSMFRNIQEDFDNGLITKDDAEKKVSEVNKELSKLGKGVKPFKLGTGTFETGSIADYNDKIQKLDTKLNSVNLTEAERNRLLRERAKIQKSLDGMQAVSDAVNVDFSDDSGNDSTDYETLLERLNRRRADLLKKVRPDMTTSVGALDIKTGKTEDLKFDFTVEGMNDLAEVSNLIDKIRKRKKKLDKESTKKGLMDQYGGEVVQTQQNIIGLAKSFETCGATAETVGSAIAFAGQSLQQLGGKGAAAKAAAIASSIGQLALGYAYATSQAGQQLGPWGWVAFGLAGLAQLITMVNTISGFATGGIVGGNSYTGDRVVAHVNSGEMILNAREQARLFQIATGAMQPVVSYPARTVAPSVNTSDFAGSGMMSSGKIIFKVRGRDMVAMLANETRIGSKIGKRTNINI